VATSDETYAADGRWGIGAHGLLSGFFAASDAQGPAARPIAWNLAGRYDGPSWLLDVKLSEVGAGFDPQVGFLERENYRKGEVLLLHRLRPTGLFGLKELRPHTHAWVYLKPDGFVETRFVHFDNHAEWRNGLQLRTAVNFTREGVLERFQIDPKRMIFIEPGVYDHVETQVIVETPAAFPVSGQAELLAGGFFGGSRVSPRARLLARIGHTLSGELRWEHNRVRVPGGPFNVNLGVFRLSYSFTPRAFVQSLLQYNDRFDVWSTNVRLGWIRDANTGLFLVYNDNRGIGLEGSPDRTARGVHLRDRSLVLKVSWLFDVLR
jgi:hypothetical protein